MVTTNRLTSQAVLGVVVVLIGVLLLVDSTGIADTSFLLTYVSTLFVLLGVYALLTSGFRNVFGPLVVIVLAGAWQIAALDLLPETDLSSFWPALIIIFGISLLLGRARTTPEEVNQEHIDGLAVFGGRTQRVTDSHFTSADLTALFGGYELDLRDATVDSKPARISAIAMFGGVDLIVPRDWNVRVDVLPIFGGAEDDRPHHEGEHEEVDLVVTGFAAFGGVSVSD